MPVPRSVILRRVGKIEGERARRQSLSSTAHTAHTAHTVARQSTSPPPCTLHRANRSRLHVQILLPVHDAA